VNVAARAAPPAANVANTDNPTSNASRRPRTTDRATTANRRIAVAAATTAVCAQSMT
jgi:hypothetical protein